MRELELLANRGYCRAIPRHRRTYADAFVVFYADGG